jgi:hypothetical protein
VAGAEFYIEGLDDFRKALRKVDSSYGKRIGQINKRAGEKVARDASSRYAQHYTPRSGRAQRTIKASAAQRQAQVKIGAARAPYVVGQEFGSNRYPQFAPGTGKQGRFLYPAVREETPKLVDEYLKELDDVAREAFPGG